METIEITMPNGYEITSSNEYLSKLPTIEQIIGVNPYTLEATKLTPIRRSNLIGRNEPCSCSSGKKFKKCCLRKM